jgi:hypothetical protein
MFGSAGMFREAARESRGSSAAKSITNPSRKVLRTARFDWCAIVAQYAGAVIVGSPNRDDYGRIGARRSVRSRRLSFRQMLV